MKYYLLLLFTGLVSLPVLSKTVAYPDQQQVNDCKFDVNPNWWADVPSDNFPPAEVPDNPITESPEFCEFYQFSWDWIRYLVAPSDVKQSDSVARFQNQAEYPLLESGGTNSCDGVYPINALNMRTLKSIDDSSPFVIPDRENQAGAGAIYDQNGNVVFYEIRFSNNLCQYKNIQKGKNFPGKTVEMKTAWRIMTPAEKASGKYYMMKAVIAQNDIERSEPMTLGLVGFHIAISAVNHPEMVWVTLEHNDNTLLCRDIGPNAKGGSWSFISEACATGKLSREACSFNKTQPFVSIHAPSKITEICQEFVSGSASSDNNSVLNTELIAKLNQYINGPNSIFQDAPEALQVWKNYFVLGALWVSNIHKPASADNQRGSLQLANTVMETEFQGNYESNDPAALNCFGCHRYNGATANNVNGGLSHIFDDIIKGIETNKKPVCENPSYSGNIPIYDAPIERCNIACAPKKWTKGVINRGLYVACECCP